MIETSETLCHIVEMYACLRHYSSILTYDLDLWPLILKTFSAVTTHVMNICGKFRWNPSTKYTDIASRGISVNGRTTAKQCLRQLLLAAEP